MSRGKPRAQRAYPSRTDDGDTDVSAFDFALPLD